MTPELFLYLQANRKLGSIFIRSFTIFFQSLSLITIFLFNEIHTFFSYYNSIAKGITTGDLASFQFMYFTYLWLNFGANISVGFMMRFRFHTNLKGKPQGDYCQNELS
jgi:hypothetical protein